MTGLDRALGRLVEIVPHLRGSTVADGDGWTSGSNVPRPRPDRPAGRAPGRRPDRPFRVGPPGLRLGVLRGVRDPPPRHCARGVAAGWGSARPVAGAHVVPGGGRPSVRDRASPGPRATRSTSSWTSSWPTTSICWPNASPIGCRSVGRCCLSNIASAVSTSGLAVVRAAGSGGLPDPGRTVEAFRAALPEHIASLGHWVPGPNWMRGACCLWFREDPSGAMCTLCPITERTDPA